MYCFWICEGETLCPCFLCNLVPFWSNENIKDLCKLPRFMTSFVGGRCVECQVWHNIAKAAAESRSLQFQTTISSIWLSAHQFSSSATAGTRPASDGAPGLRFSVSDSLAQYLWVSVGLSSSSLLFFFFFLPPLSLLWSSRLPTAADISRSLRACRHAALQGRRGETL